ncbi:MAG: response regulator transcription factor [Nitrososphaera sp.]
MTKSAQGGAKDFPTILLVDDEEDILIAIAKMLKSEGYDVHAFEHSIKALQHIKEENCQKCGFVVCDIKMAELSGFELTRQLKQLRPAMKVLLMSAFVIEKREFNKVLPSIKADGFIAKPFSKQELLEAVRALLT